MRTGSCGTPGSSGPGQHPGSGSFDDHPQALLEPGVELASISSCDRDPKRALFEAGARLLATEIVLPDPHNSLLVGARVA